MVLLLSLPVFTFAEEKTITKNQLYGTWLKAIPFGHIDRRMVREFRFSKDGKGSFSELDYAIEKDGSVTVIRTSKRNLNWLLKGSLITAWDSGKELEDTDTGSLLKYEVLEVNGEKLVFRWPGSKNKNQYQKIM